MFAHVLSQNILVNFTHDTATTVGDADDVVRDDAVARLDDDDDLGLGEEMAPLEIPRGFRLQVAIFFWTAG